MTNDIKIIIKIIKIKFFNLFLVNKSLKMKEGNSSQLKEIKVFNPKGKALKIYPLWLDSEERKIYWDIIINYSNLKSSTNIKNCYDHKLKRNGHNFCRGQIGERNYDLVFIQSIDGVISIYEQDSFINLVSFSEVIFPGQIGFINRKDSFVITNTLVTKKNKSK